MSIQRYPQSTKNAWKEVCNTKAGQSFASVCCLNHVCDAQLLFAYLVLYFFSLVELKDKVFVNF